MSSLKSRPTYPGLRPVAEARRNLVVVDAAGAAVAARLLSEAPDGFAERTEVIDAEVAETGLRELDGRLAQATMGTRVYVAGSEGLIGRVVLLATEHGIDPRSVLTEHVGTSARRVQCVHCKVTTESVTTTPYECPGCGLLLLVRDHYSQRLAAFQGVCINAEDPSERPDPELAFP